MKFVKILQGVSDLALPGLQLRLWTSNATLATRVGGTSTSFTVWSWSLKPWSNWKRIQSQPQHELISAWISAAVEIFFRSPAPPDGAHNSSVPLPGKMGRWLMVGITSDFNMFQYLYLSPINLHYGWRHSSFWLIDFPFFTWESTGNWGSFHVPATIINQHQTAWTQTSNNINQGHRNSNLIYIYMYMCVHIVLCIYNYINMCVAYIYILRLYIYTCTQLGSQECQES